MIPSFTPIINQYAYGSGIIASYFLGTALITLLSILMLTIVNGSGVSLILPSFALVISGVLYGGGMLSLQKSVERAPSPAIATLFTRNRSFVNAMLAFFIFGVSSSFIGSVDIYIAQAILVILFIIVSGGYNTGGGEEHTWQVYSYMSMILMAMSDVVVKNMVGYTNLLTNITWFSLSASIIPMISLYRKTGDFVFTYREENREDNMGVVVLFLLLIGIFSVEMISQYVAIGIAPNSANVRIIGSFAVPLTALLTYFFRNIPHSTENLGFISAFTTVGLMSGLRSLL